MSNHDRVRLVVLSGAAERQHVLAVVGRRIVVDRVEIAAQKSVCWLFSV